MPQLKVLIVSTEVSPYAKSGGLGEVAGSLPKALEKNGVDARVVFPKYKNSKDKLKNPVFLASYPVTLGWRSQNAAVSQIEAEVTTYVIENEYYFGRDGFYGYGDDFERFAFFTKAAIEMLAQIDFQADVVHFNDWQTGLGPVYLNDIYRRFVFYEKMKSIFTIHNLQYQGVFGQSVLGTIGLNDGYFTSDKLEFYGNISFMKAGIVYADTVTTVSQTYSMEIQTPGYGYGMDGVLVRRRESLVGILNGIDDKRYNPETDDRIFEKYSAKNFEPKKNNKAELQKMLNLPVRPEVPIIGLITRLVDQKGLDLINISMGELMNKDIQMVVLGTGDWQYENMFKYMAGCNPSKVNANICFNEDLAQKIYAGSDMFLMPSLFEPCGLGQLFSMRYGTIPIVRNTGGLADTVKHFNSETRQGNGFVFNDYRADGMMWGINTALSVFYNRPEWETLIRNAMECDFSWNRSATQYIELYKKTGDY